MPQLPAALPGQLLQWYDENRRILPWREKPSPYRTWISEVMLQQTRVEAGIAYFERFTAALPDIPALAAVEEQQLLKLWEGLGYYSRARNLKKAATLLMQEHNGQLPADFAALCRLPGLGEYSAGAIASIAFDIRVPAVDGNVLRVAARLMNDARNIEDTAVKKEFRQIVWEVLPQHRVGDFNQSLMELGALICLPNGRPLCESCPVRDLCQAWRRRDAACPAHPAEKAPPPQGGKNRTAAVPPGRGTDHPAPRGRPARLPVGIPHAAGPAHLRRGCGAALRPHRSRDPAGPGHPHLYPH